MPVSNVIERTVDIDNGIKQEDLHRLFAVADAGAHTFKITVTSKGIPQSLSGHTVIGYFMTNYYGTVVINGSVSNNVATLILPATCYANNTGFQLIIRLVSGSTKTAIYWGTGYVTRSATDPVIDPGSVVPDLDDILAELDQMEQATQAANTAADNANAAASKSIRYDTAQSLTDVQKAQAQDNIGFYTDDTLTVTGVAADAKKVGDELSDLKDDLNYSKTATPGNFLRATTRGHGTEWVPIGTPTDAQTEQAVSDWLDDHPEATTTVQDGAITEAKLHNDVKAKLVEDDSITEDKIADEAVTLPKLADDVLELINTPTGKEVWVDNYNSIEAAIADGDIINFTFGKTYEVNTSIVINKACYLKGNGCIIHSDPREADPNNPRYTRDGRPTQLLVFDIQHDNVIIENFNATSETEYYWENGGEIFTNTLGSNVWFTRISANYVYVRNIKTENTDGAIRVVDDAHPEDFTYHDVIIDGITSLNGIINVYVGNVIRCSCTNLLLSNSQNMQDSHGHCIYISRGVKHVTFSNFTIYHNGGLLGGLSVHPSSSQNKALCSYVNISNGVIYSTMANTFAIQITWVRNIYLSNITVQADNAESVYVSGEVNDIVFNGCTFSGGSEVVRNNFQDYSGGQREIIYNSCRFTTQSKAQEYTLLKGLEGSFFKSCEFFIPNFGSYTAPVCTLFSTKPVNTSKNFNVIFDGCYVRTFSDVVLYLFSQENTVESEVIINNTTVHSSASTSSLLADGVTLYSKLRIHNLTGVNYTVICDSTTWSNSLSKIYIDSRDTLDSHSLRQTVLANSTKQFKLKKENPNIIVMYKTTGACAVAIAMYSVPNITYLTNAIDNVTVTKNGNDEFVTITNGASGSMFVSIIW